MKKALSLVLTLAMMIPLAVTSYADGSPYTFKDEYVQITNVIADTAGEHFDYDVTCTAPAEVITIAGLIQFDGSTSMDFADGYRLVAQDWAEYENPPFVTPFIRPGAKYVLSDPGVYYVATWTYTEQFTPPKGHGYKITVVADAPADPEPTTPSEPETPTTPTVTVENIPASGTAVASTQTVTVDGRKVEFQMYALVDENGNGTNYIKLRDMAQVLNGTAAQFSVGYDNASKLISVATGEAYASTGTEMTTPFSGNRSYTGGAQTVQINGKAVDMTAITLLDDAGGGYNYFKLRDLGAALGFNVGYSNEQGVYIESDKPYLG